MARRLDKSIEKEPIEKLRAQTLSKDAFKAASYEFDESYTPNMSLNAHSVRTVDELVQLMESDPTIEIDARVMGQTKSGFKHRKLDRSEFIEAYKNNSDKTKFKESVDFFNSTDDLSSSGLVGQDFLPLLGGPFNKQLYLTDYLKMHAACFQAYNHDPMARAIVHITRDFTLGKGWRVDCKNPIALALWRAFEEVNDLPNTMDYFSLELSIYGESFIWWLPNNETKITYQLMPGQEPPQGSIPRVRLIDPSVIWEIVTYPEDITRVLYYQWVAPTQYQIYTGKDGGKNVPSTKFIFQQLPPDQIQHHKVNSVSNEKRGRSDLFPVLGYLKRLRDSINYSIIAMQKACAWGMDTTIQGNQTDIDNYISSQQAQTSIAPAGSEFVHTDKIKREYLSNLAAGKGGNNMAFEWNMSLIAAGSGIPSGYFGTHLSGGGSRASAIVATEPVAKKFELRQLVLERAIKQMAKKLFEKFGIEDEIEVTFPEIITQDRSAKLKDLALAEQMKWISPERAATIAAKELGITDYEWEEESQEIKDEAEEEPMFAPLSTPPVAQPQQVAQDEQTNKPSAVTSDEKKDLKKHGRGL